MLCALRERKGGEEEDGKKGKNVGLTRLICQGNVHRVDGVVVPSLGSELDLLLCSLYQPRD